MDSRFRGNDDVSEARPQHNPGVIAAKAGIHLQPPSLAASQQKGYSFQKSPA
jgi:hypothetical protein